MTKSFSIVDWPPILRELQSESDRAAGIVATSLVENAMENAIRARLLPVSKAHNGKLFGDRGPLGTFSAKIDLGFSLGLFGKAALSDLHNIRRIRNRFAHDFDVDFAQDEVIKFVNLMTNYNPDVLAETAVTNHIPKPFSTRTVMRWKFMSAVISIVDGLLREVSEPAVVKLPSHLA